MKTTVVNLRRSQYEAYIGRGSIWGNPFVIGRDGDRATVIQKYRAWIVRQPAIQHIETLRGKVLGCYCKPQACHGDVLVELLGKGGAQ